MTLEIVTVRILSGMDADYERVFHEKVGIIAASEGYIGNRLMRCLEAPDKFIVLVQWRKLEDHKGFNRAPEYQLWKQRIHPFYAAPSVVEHFDAVSAGGHAA
jgi:heme-degrading monooxygenase HmoA